MENSTYLILKVNHNLTFLLSFQYFYAFCPSSSPQLLQNRKIMTRNVIGSMSRLVMYLCYARYSEKVSVIKCIFIIYCAFVTHYL